MIEKLRAEFGGVLLQPGDDGYDAARSVWNGAIDQPACGDRPVPRRLPTSRRRWPTRSGRGSKSPCAAAGTTTAAPRCPTAV